jgi:hypothetical protein
MHGKETKRETRIYRELAGGKTIDLVPNDEKGRDVSAQPFVLMFVSVWEIPLSLRRNRQTYLGFCRCRLSGG